MNKIFFFFLIFLFAFGCKKSHNTINATNENATDVFPNKIGDTWVYVVNDTTVHQLTGQGSSIAQYNMTVTVVDSIPLPASLDGWQLPKGPEANIWVYNFSGNTDTNYVCQIGDTLHFFGFTPPPESFSRQYIVPLNLNNSWQYTPAGLGSVTIDSDAGITVGQNHFDNAFHIFGYGGMPDEGFSVEEWIVNNVGIVKRHLQTGGIGPDRHFTKWSLVSYHLK